MSLSVSIKYTQRICYYNLTLEVRQWDRSVVVSVNQVYSAYMLLQFDPGSYTMNSKVSSSVSIKYTQYNFDPGVHMVIVNSQLVRACHIPV